MLDKSISVKNDCSGVDEMTKKVSRLVELLKEVNSLIGSLGRKDDDQHESAELLERVSALERLATANSFCFGSSLTFPEYVRKTEKIISRLADCDRKGD